jgi:RimJ/RimL family protein N-acetyltransferase
MQLLAATDAYFDWMLGGRPPDPALRLPPGGVDSRAIVHMLRDTAARVRAVHGGGTWIMIADSEAVGLCSYKQPADGDGMIEIGYGVAESRRRAGHATRAVAALLRETAADGLVRSVTAQTAVANIASQRVLTTNGFVQTGNRSDEEDGELILWRHVRRSARIRSHEG